MAPEKGTTKTGKESKDLKTLTVKLPWLQVWDQTTVSSRVTSVDVVQIPAPKLCDMGMNEPTGTPEGYQCFLAQIRSVVKHYGTSAVWDADMLRETAQLAFQEAGFLNVAEVKYFVTRIKCGKYPSHKNFTPAIFMETLNNYIAEILGARHKVPAVWKEPAQPADSVKIQRALKHIIKLVTNAEHLHFEEARQRRKEQTNAMKRHRDQQIVDLVERDARDGIAPDKAMKKIYLEALERLAEK